MLAEGTMTRPGDGTLVALLVLVVLVVRGTATAACAAEAHSGPVEQSPDGSAGIFADAPRPATVAQNQPPGVLRERFVTIDFSQLAPETNERLVLKLFPDTTLTAVRDRVDPTDAGFVWVGRIDGAQSSEVTLVVGSGILTGTIRADAAMYSVRIADDPVHAIYEVDQGAYPAD
jgi:hypothetical protein